MATTVNVGHKINCALQLLDQSGNPMLVTPTPDSVPTWTNGSPAVDTLVAAVDGMSAVDTAIAPGSDTIQLSGSFGGTTFTASLAVTVTPVPQVLTSVVIVPTVV